MIKEKGFTLIELMVVVSIIGVLASVSLPQYQSYVHKSEVVDALSMASTIREDVTAYYVESLEFPKDNLQARVPLPDKLISNRVTSISIKDGAIHITLGNKIAKPLQGKVLTFRPAVVDGSPLSPISWLCGYDKAVSGMSAIGKNETTIPNEYLPNSCVSR